MGIRIPMDNMIAPDWLADKTYWEPISKSYHNKTKCPIGNQAASVTGSYIALKTCSKERYYYGACIP